MRRLDLSSRGKILQLFTQKDKGGEQRNIVYMDACIDLSFDLGHKTLIYLCDCGVVDLFVCFWK